MCWNLCCAKSDRLLKHHHFSLHNISWYLSHTPPHAQTQNCLQKAFKVSCPTNTSPGNSTVQIAFLSKQFLYFYNQRGRSSIHPITDTNINPKQKYDLLLPLLAGFLFGTALKKLLGKFLGFRSISKIGSDIIMNLIRRFHFFQERNECRNCNKKGKWTVRWTCRQYTEK